MAKKTVFCGFEWARVENAKGDRLRCGGPGCSRGARGRKVWFSEDLQEFACGKGCAEAASEAEERVRNGGVYSIDDVVVDGYTLREHDHRYFDRMQRNWFD